MPFLLFIVIFTASAKETRPEWVEQARQLIGERSGIRNEALKKLSEIFPSFEDLAPELKGSNRHYALDVAVAMKFPGSAERLLREIDSDRDGSITLAVNALLDKDNHNAIGQRYLEFLEKRPLTEMATPVVLAMVDFFTHLRREFPDSLFSALLAHPRLEVQQSAALYFAVTGFKGKQQAVDTRSPQLYPQVRAQLMMTYFENKDQDRAAKICHEDQDAIVQSACQGLQFEVVKAAKTKEPTKLIKPKSSKPKRKAKP